MKDGFIKVAALTPKIKVADCIYNGEMICKQIEEAYDGGAKILVFPAIPARICSGRNSCCMRPKKRCDRSWSLQKG